MEQCGSHVCFLRCSRFNRHQHINALTCDGNLRKCGVQPPDQQQLIPRNPWGFTTWLNHAHLMEAAKLANYFTEKLCLALGSMLSRTWMYHVEISFQPTFGYASEKGWKLKHSKCRADFSLGKPEKQTRWKQETYATKLCVVIKDQMLPSGDQAWRAETGILHASDVGGYNKLLSLFMHDPIILNPHILVFMNSPLFK